MDKHFEDHFKLTSDDSDQVLEENYSDTKSEYLLTWKNLEYSIENKGETIPIIKGVSGHAKSGQILAIMGSSGSGKTSLLGLLANRSSKQTHLKVSGQVCLNQIDVRSFHSTHYIKYVMQEDWLFSTQTVRESLQFAAKLKIPNLTREKMDERVNQIIEHLNLTKVADNLIGNVVRKGLSGGEKKRVSIGIELISYPSVLILDEPTSGLDSYTCKNLVAVGSHKFLQTLPKVCLMCLKHKPKMVKLLL